MNILQTPITVLDKMLVLNLNIALWSARKKITSEDVEHIPNQDLPPQDLASLGSKKIAPPESLRIFSTLKARATSMLDKYGVRFLSGWAIPEDLAQEVLTELSAIRDEFNTEKDKFLGEYDNLVSDWVSKHSKWSEMLKNSVDSPNYVRARMNFEWQLFRVMGNIEDAKNGLNTGLNSAVHGLGDTLFDDIAKTALETWTKVYEGKTSVTHKALSPLKTMISKLNGLSFIEPHVLPVAKFIETAISRIPKKGNITGLPLSTLQALVCLLKDKDYLVTQANQVLHGSNVESVLDSLLIANSSEALPVAAYVDTTENTEITNFEEETPNQIPVIADSMGLW